MNAFFEQVALVTFDHTTAFIQLSVHRHRKICQSKPLSHELAALKQNIVNQKEQKGDKMKV